MSTTNEPQNDKKYTHDDYTIGWVCALSKERTAATAMLDRRHDKLPKAPNDNNAYTLGSIGKHNIVIACLPEGKYGTNSAATVASHMLSSFPSIRVGLMVGIGGGIPPKVRLGDVVVSTPVGEYPGVVQWDMGKALEEGHFQRTGALNNPPLSLLTALTELKTCHEMTGSQIPRYLEDLRTEWPRLVPKYLRSDLLKDDLFDSKDHPHKGVAGFWSNLMEYAYAWLWAASDHESTSQKNTTIPRDMQIHYGLIASGNQVIKDAAFRDRLNKDLGGHVLCVEMEAAGLMNNFPCLVIRGICDYADSHKNKDWQEHAAAVAAAYAKELLQCVQPSDVAGERPARGIEGVLKNLCETTSATAADVALVKEKMNNKEDSEILNWLTPIDYGLQQSDYLKIRQSGTGQWLLDSDEFQTWVSVPKQTLFCPGIPGAGKTISTSIVVDHLHSTFHNDLKTGVAFIYCNFQRQNEQKLDNLLASILKQLANSQPSISRSVTDLYDRHRKTATRPSCDELVGALRSVVAIYSRVFVIVDALDECQAAESCRTRLLSELFSLQTRHGINIFATSRFIPEIQDRFKTNTSISLEICASPSDVATYLKGQMSRLPSVIQKDEQLQDEIIKEISEAVDGMFLLAQIYVKLLEDKLTLNEIRSTIEVFSKQRGKLGGKEKTDILNSAYEQALERINKQLDGFKKLALDVLAWITCAKRQLTTSELQHALATRSGKHELDEGDMVEIPDVVSVCAGLVIVDEESNIIRLVHYTTQEYLEQTKDKWFPGADSTIATACVTYLSFSVFETGFCATDGEFQQRLLLYPLYDYAANNWGYHEPSDSESVQVVVTFLEDQAKVEASSQALMAEKRYRSRGYSQRVPKNTTGLHLVGYFGAGKVLNRLLEFERALDIRDTYGQTPLLYAANNGHKIVVNTLLAAGADVNAAAAGEYGGRTALQAAAGGGHLEVVNALLAAGANVNAAAGEYGGRTALQAAAGGGHLEVVNALLTAGANVNAAAAGKYGGRTALQAAAGGGHLEVVNALLAAGANVNAAAAAGEYGGRTALQAAAGGGYLEVVNALLTAGANVNAAAGGKYNGRTALQAAAEEGHLEVVNALLTAGANVNAAAGRYGPIALQAAAGGGHLEVVNALLAAGANVNAAAAAGEYGGTALQAAARRHHLEVVNVLLAAGADVNSATGKDGWMALLAAAEGGHLEVVNALLAAGVNVNTAAGIYGPIALQTAAGGGHLEVVNALLAAGADVNAAAAAGEYGQTALRTAAGEGHLEVVNALLAAGANVNDAAGEYGGRTALQAAAGGGHLEVVNALLTAGANVNAATGKDGWMALQAAARGGYLEVVNVLLAAGVNVNTAAGRPGQIALQAAAGRGHLEVVNALLAAGADVNAATGKDGQTALQAAAGGGHLKVVNALLAAGTDVNAATGKDGQTALQAAAGGGHLKVVNALLAAGANVNAAAAAGEYGGRTALQAAAGGGYLEVVNALLAAGVNINTAAGRPGQIALQAAAGRGHLEVVNALLAAGANVNAAAAAGEYGGTALQAAARRRHLKVVNALLAAGADVNTAAGGGTALQAAAEEGHLKVVNALLVAGADINTTGGKYGRTALQTAAEEGHLEVVNALLAAGADVNAAAGGGTALQAAAEEGHLKVVNALLAAGADINTTGGKYGRTALQAAAEEGHLEVIKALRAAGT